MAIYKHGSVSGSDITFTCAVVSGSTYTWAPIGHCSSASIDVSNAYEEVRTKGTSATAGLYTRKVLVGQEITISATGFHFADETDYGYKYFLNKAISGEPFEIRMVERKDTGSSANYTPMFEGAVVINSIPLSLNAGAASSYQISLTNSGAPTRFNASNLHER